MPFRKKISRILRRVSNYNRTSKEVFPSQSVEHTATVSPVPTAPKESDPPISGPEESTGLVLYGRPSCPYCARVDRVIQELGIEEKLTRRLTTYGSEWRTDLRNKTGSTQVPCLFIDGQPMFESLDIIDWMRSNLA